MSSSIYSPPKVTPGQPIKADHYNKLLDFAKSLVVLETPDHDISHTTQGVKIKNKINGGGGGRADTQNYSFKTRYSATEFNIQTGYINYEFGSSYAINGYFEEINDGYFPIDSTAQEAIAAAITNATSLEYVLFFRHKYNEGIHLIDGQTYRYVFMDVTDYPAEITQSHAQTYLCKPIFTLKISNGIVHKIQRQLGDFNIQLHAVNTTAGSFYWQRYNELFDI